MIALFLIMAKVTQTPDYQVMWFCRNVASQQRFTLRYERRRDRIENVRVHVAGTPRLYADELTGWRAKASGQTVTFSFWNKRIGQSGAMKLVPDAENVGRYRLQWSDVMGIGGHMPLENQEESAECFSSAQQVPSQ